MKIFVGTHTWILGKVGLNLAFGLITSCNGQKTVCRRPACFWLRWRERGAGSMSTDPSKSHNGGSGDIGTSLALILANSAIVTEICIFTTNTVPLCLTARFYCMCYIGNLRKISAKVYYFWLILRAPQSRFND